MAQLDWRQGEHSVLIGETGTGKTRLAEQLLRQRQYVLVAAIKKYDESLERYAGEYELVRDWPPRYGAKRVLLWPKPGDLDDSGSQRKALSKALNSVYQSGGWCVYLDDMGYVASALGLKRSLTILLNQGRSSHISMVGSVTRPSSLLAGVPLEAFSMTRHVYLFQTGDENEHVRMAQIARLPLRRLRALLDQLGPYEFVAVNKRQVSIVGAK